jgi:hypothetical protein
MPRTGTSAWANYPTLNYLSPCVDGDHHLWIKPEEALADIDTAPISRDKIYEYGRRPTLNPFLSDTVFIIIRV